MSKYDQGGGCLCGLQKVCDCKEATGGEFIDEQGMRYAGVHVIIDMWGVDRNILMSREALEYAMVTAVEASNATLLHIHLHSFGHEQGVSGVAVLAESHISVHTWPEKEYAAFDIFMCGRAKPHLAVAVLKNTLKPKRVVVGSLKRGMMS